MSGNLKGKVVELYKNLYHMGKEYPKGANWFHERLKIAFLKNKDEKDPKKIEELIGRGEFVLKEIEALYQLKKYRTMKHRYYDKDDQIESIKKFEEKVEEKKF